MASNEHKNLQDSNRHNPKGFETATNETALSKSIGTGATNTDGNLIWIPKSSLGVTNYKFQGYATGTTNYQYGEDIADNQAPFQLAQDFGSTSATGATLTIVEFFRMGQGFIVPEAATVSSIIGWSTSNQTYTTTIAICKITPVANDATEVTPVVIDEIAAVGKGNNNLLNSISETTITAASVAAGDVIFPMIKDSSAGASLFFNLTVQTYTY